MKKRVISCIIASMMMLAIPGCQNQEAESPASATEANAEPAQEAASDEEKVKEAPESAKPEEKKEEADENTFSFENLSNLEFSFSSGVGGWGTYMVIQPDGSFSGEFFDSDYGASGDGYPDGTLYLCEFEGQFTQPVKVNDNMYSMQIAEINYGEEPGTEEIKDFMLYCYTDAYGLEGAEEILIYLPGTPLSELSEEFRNWIGYYDLAETKEDKLPFYALNVKPEEYGFTSYDISGGGESGLSDDNFRYVEVENPSWDYYCATKDQDEKEAEISLQLLSQKTNQIIDTEEWFAENGLEQPGFPYSDGIYTYETWGADAYDTYILAIANQETGEITEYDFTEFQYADTYVQEDFAYICQRIIYAQIKDNVLYVATGHSTYAESCPQNAYVTAIDLTTDRVLWKTEPLTCNSNSFVLTEQYLICGYGFTAEPDSLKIVDIGTGKVVSEIPVKSAPDYIILKDGKLFVRTYDTDYVYEVVLEN